MLIVLDTYLVFSFKLDYKLSRCQKNQYVQFSLGKYIYISFLTTIFSYSTTSKYVNQAPDYDYLKSNLYFISLSNTIPSTI